jgi:hypothetical protein
MSSSNLVINIHEYQFEWSEFEDQYKNKSSLVLIGRIMLLLKEPLEIGKRLNFLPYYPNKDNMLISGT